MPILSNQAKSIAEVAKHRYKKNQPLIIAIDGCGGAGKSTLSLALKKEIGLWAHVQVIPLDDFYQPLTKKQRDALSNSAAKAAYFNEEDFKLKVLVPLENGQSISYKPIAWIEGEASQYTYIKPEGVILIDGVFSLSQSLRPHVQVSVFIDTPSDLRRQRLEARTQPSISWVEHWQATESFHHQHEQTASHADFVCQGF